MLCESNSEGLFVTAFEGVLDLLTGEFIFVNAGHEAPYICRNGKVFELYKLKPGFVLAGVEDMNYKTVSINFEPGDKLFQYTDGVTEATNAEKELYGQERLTAVLEKYSSKSPTELLPLVREDIDAFAKFTFESQFQKISSGGAISYVEIPNMRHNLAALAEVVKFIYDNIQYAEFNTKSDYCHVCGYDGEIIINDDNEWECPCCHNKDHNLMNVTRRTCGYLGENFWNVGKTKEINLYAEFSECVESIEYALELDAPIV